jgi:hypothetical protein
VGKKGGESGKVNGKKAQRQKRERKKKNATPHQSETGAKRATLSKKAREKLNERE